VRTNLPKSNPIGNTTANLEKIHKYMQTYTAKNTKQNKNKNKNQNQNKNKNKTKLSK